MDVASDWSLYVSSARLFVISILVLANGAALWKVLSYTKNPGSREINRLTIICILVVNLAYLSLVWTPFTLGSFRHDLTHRENQVSAHIKAITSSGNTKHTAVAEELPLPPPQNNSFERTRRWAKAEISEEHKGTWTIAFPVVHRRDPKTREPLPLFLNVDCGFQDCITTSCCYSLAFVAAIHLILIKKPLSVPTTSLALTGYTAMLTGVPFLATLAIRYAEQVGSKYSPHEPEKSACGYTYYNIICDVQVSESFVFLSFLEWAGLMMVLLLTVTSFLGVSSKMETQNSYSNHLNAPKQYPNTVGGILCYYGGHYTRETVLCLGAFWSWPLKPASILLAYVIYGKHWTNSISWVSHSVVTSSVVFVSLATMLSKETFTDEEETEEVNRRPQGLRMPPKKSLSEIMIFSPDLLTVPHSKIEKPPSYEQHMGRYSRQIDEEEPTESSQNISKGTSTESSKCALEIKNNLERISQQSTEAKIDDKKFVLSFAVNKDFDDTKIILNHMEGCPTSYSEV